MVNENEQEHKAYRMKTLFSYLHKKDEEPRELLDACYIYRDSLNEGAWVALSLDHSKVGHGSSYEEAYVDLVVSIAHAIRYRVKTKPDEKIDIGPKQPRIKFLESRYGHRLEEDTQLELLWRAIAEIEGVPLNREDQDVIFNRCEMKEDTLEFTPIVHSARGTFAA